MLLSRVAVVFLLGWAGSNVLAASGQTDTASYTYDALGRLVSVDYAPDKSVTYAYDAAGNRTSVVAVGVEPSGGGGNPGGGGGNVISGTPGDDTLTGTSGNDVINGLGGDDQLHGSAGSDTIDGGPGYDTFVIFGAVPADVTFVEQADGSVTVSYAGSSDVDTLLNVEAVWFDAPAQWFAITDLIGAS